MSRYTLFLGCNIPARVPQYRDSARAVCKRLEIRLETLDEFTCCGYPMRNIDESVFLACTARNLALAEQQGNALMVLCKCCFGSLKSAQALLAGDPECTREINRLLEKEGLTYTGNIRVRHLLTILHEDVGPDRLKSAIQQPYAGLNIAASVGCHALRPSNVTGFDDPAAPTLFDRLVKITGAKAVDWAKKSDCCGAPLLGINDALSHRIMQSKLADALDNKADFMAVACPYSFLQFDAFQQHRSETDQDLLAPVLYPQLLGLAMGISSAELGLTANNMDISALESFLSQETSHA